MRVNDSCIGCKDCLPYCTQGAIFMTEGEQAAIDRDLCVECGVCIDMDICSVSAFEEDDDAIAEFKKPFGRLLSKHLDAKSFGKGSSYDVKTNDVTGKIPNKKVVMRLELNRPGGGVQFGDMEQLRTEMTRMGWNSDIFSRSKRHLGTEFSDKLADQRIFTCNLEFVLDPEDIPEVVNGAVQFIALKGFWVTINVAGLAETISHTQKVLESAGIKIEPVAKVNLGLGRRC